MVRPPEPAVREIVSRIDAATAGAVDVEVQAFTKIDGTGEITGSKVIHNVTLGSDVVIASLP